MAHGRQGCQKNTQYKYLKPKPLLKANNNYSPLTNPPSVDASSLSLHKFTTGSDSNCRISSAFFDERMIFSSDKSSKLFVLLVVVDIIFCGWSII